MFLKTCFGPKPFHWSLLNTNIYLISGICYNNEINDRMITQLEVLDVWHHASLPLFFFLICELP